MIPTAILFLTGLLATLLGVEAPVRWVRWVVRAGLALALGAALFFGAEGQAFGGLFLYDGFARVAGVVGMVAGLFASLVGARYLERAGMERFEYHALLAYSVFGVQVMAASANLVVILIGLEILSLPLYALAALRYDAKSEEAGLKYFLLGAVASAVMLYGIVLLYGATGSFAVSAVGQGPLYLAGLLLVLAGLFFKASLVPFHWWAPDVYQGAPTPVTLYMATGVKAAAFAALARVVVGAGVGGLAGAVVALVVVLTVFYGNLGALAQSEAKRLLAYSSVAHAGYIALAVFGPNPAPAMGFYLFVYALSTGLAFAVLSQLDAGAGVPFADLKGLIKKSPMLAGVLAISLFSLAGMPPFAGFWGKYLVFVEAARGGQYALVAFALLTAVVAAYYYMKLLALAFFAPADEGGKVPEVPALAAVTLGLVGFLVVALGVFPGLVYGFFNVGGIIP